MITFIDLPSRYPDNIDFLIKLMELSTTIKVTFSTSSKELQFLIEKEKEYNRRNINIIQSL